MIENFGPNVKRLREQHDMTQEQLADVIEVQRDTISKIERGKRSPSFDTLDRLARFFNVTPVDLLGTPDEQAIASIPAILDRIDSYHNKIQNVFRLTHRMESFSPQQLQHLQEQVESIFSYFRPRTRKDEDGVPELDKNGRRIMDPPPYHDIPIGEIDRVFKEIQEIKAFRNENK